MLGFILKNWRTAALALGAVTFWGTVVLMRNQIEDLRADVALAQEHEQQARTAAAIEAGNADRLTVLLEQAMANTRAEQRARDAALAERDSALEAAARNAQSRQEVIIQERELDPTLDRCLAYELPDSLVRQLPFGPREAGPDTGGDAGAGVSPADVP